MDFEEWFESLDLDNWTNKKYMHDAFEAGQQSKQVEIDELQKRINNALNEIESGITGKHHVKSIIKILKGE